MTASNENLETIAHALNRARELAGQLNISRGSEDLERVRKGVEHELETCMRVLGEEWISRGFEVLATLPAPSATVGVSDPVMQGEFEQFLDESRSANGEWPTS